jgi:hypothetical protein
MDPLTYGATWLAWFLTVPAVAAGVGNQPTAPLELRHAGIVRQATQTRAHAQSPKPVRSPVTDPAREFFVSWGYNGDSYTKSDMHFTQPSLGNDFTLVDVRAEDAMGWPDIWNHSLFGPQYNIRFGLFFNEKWGAEVALDHIKWITVDDQQVHMTGTLKGAAVDTNIALTENVLRYQLNNGANPIFFNVVRRMHLHGEPRRAGHVAFLLKGGAGFAVPHTQNTLFGQPNTQGFQPFKGWDLDAAAAVRAHVWSGLYVEFEDKLLYARYFGVKVNQGTEDHSVKANEFSLNFGFAFR